MKARTPIVTLLVTFAVVLLSCTKEEINTETEKQIKRHLFITANLPALGDIDKVNMILSTDGFNFMHWQDGDCINVNGTELSTISTDTSTAEFEGEVSVFRINGKNTFFAVYPTSIANNISPEELSVNIPTIQYYNPLPAYRNYMVAKGYTEGIKLNLNFKNLCSLLHLQISGTRNNLQGDAAQITKIVVTSGNTTLNGVGHINLDDYDPDSSEPFDIQYTLDGSKSTTLVCATDSGFVNVENSEKDFYIFLPATGNINNLSVKIYNAEGNYMKLQSSLEGTNFRRSTIYTAKVDFLANERDPYLPGGFEISNNRSMGMMHFAPANLYYNITTDTFGFFANQYEISEGYGWNINHNSGTVGYDSTNNIVSLFGWGTSTYDNTATDQYATRFMPQDTQGWWGNMLNDLSGIEQNGVNDALNTWGYGPSGGFGTNYWNIHSTPYDWGIYRRIWNPKKRANDRWDNKGFWTTPTTSQWQSLITHLQTSGANFRANGRTYTNVKYAKACIRYRHPIEGMVTSCGLFLFPDDFAWPPNTSQAPPENYNDQTLSFSNAPIYTEDDLRRLENVGLVFLPAAGIRISNNLSEINKNGLYWSAEAGQQLFPQQYASAFRFGETISTINHNHPVQRCCGLSVRLVHIGD